MSRDLSGLMGKWVVWGQGVDARYGTVVGFDGETGEIGILHLGLITWQPLTAVSLFDRRRPAVAEKDTRVRG